MKKLRGLFLATIVALSSSVSVMAWEVHDVDWDKVSVTVGEEEPSANTNNNATNTNNNATNTNTSNVNTPSEWAKTEVESAISNGLVPTFTGTPKYTDAITREQFAELVVCMIEKVQGEEIQITDVKFTDSSNVNVLKAASIGVVTGVGDNKFDPKSKTNREQIATMLSRAVTYLETETNKDITTADTYNLNNFSDKGEVSNWALDGVGMLAANGIMQGTSSSTLSPKSSCTVEQSIILVYRIYNQF